MKIGLIDPGSKKLIFNENFPHPGIAYVAAILEERGYQVETLDVNLAGERGTDQFLKEDYDLIGLSVTSFTFSQVLEMARRIKAISGNTIIVIGGPHVPIGMESTLDSPHVDYAIYGEGEFTMLELTELLEKTRQPKIENLLAIRGLIFKDGSRRIVNLQRPRIDNLDGLPFPAFQLFDMDQYGTYPLLTSRGCPFGCMFCSIKAIWGKAWHFRSAENILLEIDYARQRFRWESKPFNIIDDSFNVDPDRVRRFCELIIERGVDIRWFSSGFRADRVSADLALRMKEAGCLGVSVGIESANNEILRSIKKKTTIEEITRGCQNLARVGISVQAQFMIGNPGDTFETVKESIEYARRQNFSSVAFYLALPYPKTELWDYVKERGTFLKEDYTQFHHFSNEPVFETPEFPARQREKAYVLGRKLSLKTQLRQEVKTKLARMRRVDFAEMSLRRVAKAFFRLTKYLLDLSFGRAEKV